MAEQVEFVLEEVDRKTFFILSGTCCHGNIVSVTPASVSVVRLK